MKRKSIFLIFALMAIALPYERELAQSKQPSTPTTVTATSSDCVSTAGTDRAIKKLSTNPPKASECFVARDLICVGCRRGAPVNLRPPCYPRLASSAKVSGAVIVEVAVNEKGNVFWAH